MVRRLAFQNPSDPKNRVAMNRAKFTARGQITVPAEERRRLHHVPGDKVLFVEKPSGEVVAAKARLAALAQARDAFAGAATDVGVSDEDDVQALVDDMRDRGVWPESSLTPMSSAALLHLGTAGATIEPAQDQLEAVTGSREALRRRGCLAMVAHRPRRATIASMPASLASATGMGVC